MVESRISAATWGLMTLLALIWGGSFLAIRTALDEIPPLSSVAHRVLWAALALWIAVLVRRVPLPRDPRVWGCFLVMGCLNNVIPFSLMAWGQMHIETGLTAILNASTAIWGVLVAAIVFTDERLTLRRLIGVLIGFSGVVVAIGPQNIAALDLRSLGQIAVVCGSVSYALAGSWARARLAGQSPLVSATGMLTGSTLVMLPLAALVEGPLPLDLSLRAWVAIGYYALISTALAYIFYYAILARAGAGTLLVVTLMIPPVAILLGAAVRNEVLDWRAYAGFALLACGLSILGGRGRNGGRKSPVA